jgi:DNA-binding MarR family transcriptional regulator
MSRQLEHGAAQTLALAELVSAARSSIRRATASCVAPFGLTPRQFTLLWHVSRASGAALKELADAEQLDEPATSRVLASLRDRGLVTASPGHGDRRRLTTHLTARGHSLVARLGAVNRRVQAAQTRGLSRDAVRRAARVLKQVIVNMHRFALESR